MVHVTQLEKKVEPSVVEALKRKLTDPSTSLPQRYRVLFSLRNVQGAEAHAAMLEGLKDSSALFRHEVAYCLGQRQDAAAVPVLIDILKDTSEHPMVRHEAGEALGAIGTEACLAPLREHVDDPCLEVAQTCQLALQRIEYFRRQGAGAGAGAGSPAAAGEEGEGDAAPANGMEAAAAAETDDANAVESPYLSVDPSPAAPAATPTPQLRHMLLDEREKIFQRYCAMFALRNKGGPEAVGALSASFGASVSALLKHEVAYVLGQMQDAHAVDMLRRVLEDPKENPMVRHEAAEALGSIADEQCIALLQQYMEDPEPIVAHSCEVALDMLEFERSGAFQYADEGN
ncbi:hypothetical protein N2152v2_010338 [Parachlorella kessleri]